MTLLLVVYLEFLLRDLQLLPVLSGLEIFVLGLFDKSQVVLVLSLFVSLRYAFVKFIDFGEEFFSSCVFLFVALQLTLNLF